MSTSQVLIVALAAVLTVALVALAKWRIRVAELASEDRRRDNEARRAAAEGACIAAAAARRSPGPADGAVVGVHLGDHLIQGRRVLRDEPDAEGWIALDGAELLEGGRSTPLGGRQWLRDAQWIQEL